MHRVATFAVLVLGVFAASARAEHGAASSFKAPVSTMSDTTRVSNLPRPASLSMPSSRGAAGNTESTDKTKSTSTSSTDKKSGSNASSSSSGPTYKPNVQEQTAMSAAGQKNREGLAKLGQDSLTTTTAMTNNFLKGVADGAKTSEEYASLSALSGRVSSTAGTGATKPGFDALIQDTERDYATRQDILKQIGMRQLATVPPPVPQPTQRPPTPQERLNAWAKTSRPNPSGDPMSVLPAGFEAKGEKTSLQGIGTR